MKNFNKLTTSEQEIINNLVDKLIEKKQKPSSLSFINDLISEKDEFNNRKELVEEKNRILLLKFLTDFNKEVNKYNEELKKVGVVIKQGSEVTHYRLHSIRNNNILATFHIANYSSCNTFGNTIYHEINSFYIEKSFGHPAFQSEFKSLFEILNYPKFQEIIKFDYSLQK